MAPVVIKGFYLRTEKENYNESVFMVNYGTCGQHLSYECQP